MVAIVATLGIGSSTARADHDHRYASISAQADGIVCAARDLNDELRYRFHDSRRYGDLLATNARIRSKANYLRAHARSGRCGPTFVRFLAELDEQICRMDSLIADANFRAQRGFDPPLGCTHAAEAYVAQMHRGLFEIQNAVAELNAPPVVIPYNTAPSTNYGQWQDYRGTAPWSGRGPSRGISVGREGVTLSTGGLSVHFNR